MCVTYGFGNWTFQIKFLKGTNVCICHQYNHDGEKYLSFDRIEMQRRLVTTVFQFALSNLAFFLDISCFNTYITECLNTSSLLQPRRYEEFDVLKRNLTICGKMDNLSDFPNRSTQNTRTYNYSLVLVVLKRERVSLGGVTTVL